MTGAMLLTCVASLMTTVALINIHGLINNPHVLFHFCRLVIDPRAPHHCGLVVNPHAPHRPGLVDDPHAPNHCGLVDDPYTSNLHWLVDDPHIISSINGLVDDPHVSLFLPEGALKTPPVDLLFLFALLSPCF